MKQFNWIYRCVTCLYPEEHYRTYIYPLGITDPTRTLENIHMAVFEAKRTGTTVYCVKNVSPFSNYMHSVDGVPNDYMHCVLYGVVNSPLILWTNAKHHDEPFSVCRHFLIESLLCSILPTCTLIHHYLPFI